MLLDSGSDVMEASGMEPFETARTVMVLGQLERRLGHRRAAGVRLDAALVAFEALPAPIWVTHVQRELDRLGRRRAGADELTPAGDTGRGAHRDGSDQSRGRRASGPEPEDRRGAPRACLRQARHPLSRGARSLDGRASTAVPDPRPANPRCRETPDAGVGTPTSQGHGMTTQRPAVRTFLAERYSPGTSEAAARRDLDAATRRRARADPTRASGSP